MIKKISLFFVLSFSLITVSLADEQHKVRLDDDKHSKETIECASFNIILELTDVKESGKVNVNIELENIGETRGVSLFDGKYKEKELKKKRPKIKFDKTFSGTKGQRVVTACDKLENSVHLYPLTMEQVITLSAEDGKTTSATLPIYVVEYKKRVFSNKHNLILLQKEVIELEIGIDLKPSKQLVDITNGCDSLLMEFDNTIFCTNKRHKPSLEEQQGAFQHKVDSLVEKIDSIISYHGWFSSDKQHKLYTQQKKRIQDINLKDKEGDCGKHVIVHRCKYCSASLQQISHKFDDIYQIIYISNERSVTKAEHLGDVNALMNCAKRRRDWRRSEYKDKIERLYKEINLF